MGYKKYEKRHIVRKKKQDFNSEVFQACHSLNQSISQATYSQIRGKYINLPVYY